MAYFSNGCEGDSFHAHHCAKCVHDLNGKCVVWNLHLAHNYDQFPEHAKTPEAKATAEVWKEVLDVLIPDEGCRMFREATAEDRIAELPWKREREGKPGDRFTKGMCVVTVVGHADGMVYFTSQSGSNEPRRHESTVEHWHEAVANTMDAGATFTPAA